VAFWYRDAPLLWGIDATGPLSLSHIDRYFHITDSGLGGTDARKLAFLLPVAGFLRLWRATGIGYSFTVAQPLLIFSLLAGSGLSMYWLIRTCLPRILRASAVAGALFYTFNLYSLTVIWTPLSNLVFHYSLLPLVVCVFVRAFRARSIALGAAAGIVWALTLTPAYLTPPVLMTDLALFASVLGLHLWSSSTFREAGRVLAVASAAIVPWLCLNLFWLVPNLYFAHTEVVRGLAGENAGALFRLNSAPFEDALQLGGYWGLGASYKGAPYFSWADFYVHGIGRYLGFLLPILAVAGLSWRSWGTASREPSAIQPASRESNGRERGEAGESRKLRRASEGDMERRYLRLFGVVALVSILLMAGPHDPFGHLKSWVIAQSGLTGPFRSVYQRFGVYAALAYAPLIAAGLDRIARRSRSLPRAGQLLSSVIPALGAGVLVGVLAWPMWSGQTFTRSGALPSNRIAIPDEYGQVASWLDRQRGDFDVLEFPWGNRGLIPLSWRGGADGYLGADPLALLSSKNFLLSTADAAYFQVLVQQVTRGGFSTTNALRLLNVRYVVLHDDASRAYLAGAAGWAGVDVNRLARTLVLTPGVKLVRAGPKLRVYEVSRWRPFGVFAVSGYRAGRAIYAQSYASVRAIQYRLEAAGRYSVPSGQLRRGEVLVVNHPFDRDWRAGGESPFSVAPGMTGFRVRSTAGVIVQHQLENRFGLLLALVPATLVLAAGGGAFILYRRTRRPRVTPEAAHGT
jgi:hypothetical protein